MPTGVPGHRLYAPLPAEPPCCHLTVPAAELGIDPFADPLMLYISHAFGAKEQGLFKRDEFTSGMAKLGCVVPVPVGPLWLSPAATLP